GPRDRRERYTRRRRDGLEPKAAALFLTPEAPYPVAGGGPLRSACLLEYLAHRYAVDVIVFHEPGAADPTASFPAGLARSVHVIDLPYHEKHFAARALRNAGRMLRGVPPLIDRFAGFGNQISELIRRSTYQLSVVEHFWCAPYWEQLAPHSTQTVLDLFDIESVLHARCAQAESWPAST